MVRPGYRTASTASSRPPPHTAIGHAAHTARSSACHPDSSALCTRTRRTIGGVVISGVAVNGLPGSTDVPLPIGSYWFQKGGERHITKCISPNECVFFISQNDKLDYVAAADSK